MTDETTSQTAQAADRQRRQPARPGVLHLVNEYLELTNRQSKEQGLKRISMASLYAAARFNAHVYLSHAGSRCGHRPQGTSSTT